MNKGEVVQVGRPLEVYRSPADTFVARFLGNPPMNLLRGRLEGAGSSLRLGDAAFDLPGWSSTSLRSHLGDVTVGVRPEDLCEAPPPGLEAKCVMLPVQVITVEPLGAETLLLLSLGGSDEELIARVGRDTALENGDRASIALDPASVHLFDPVTTQTISRAR
jgi:multiple sugar transport system ATP-binding protein